VEHTVSRFALPPRRVRASLTVLLVAASSAAAVSWVRAPHKSVPAPSVQIVDVRALRSTNPDLRDLISHTFAIRVQVDTWTLDRARQSHGSAGWRLYLDGRPLGDIPGDTVVSYVYLIPGEHWIAAELRRAATSLDPPVWSQPVILHVPRVISCRQATGRASTESGTPNQTCPDSQQRLTVRPASASPRFLTAADLWWIPPGVRLLNQLLANGHSYTSMAWP
jgi:hypothetical protein